jgi:hypothetical protein
MPFLRVDSALVWGSFGGFDVRFSPDPPDDCLHMTVLTVLSKQHLRHLRPVGWCTAKGHGAAANAIAQFSV